MSRIKVFVYFIFFLIANSAVAQSIDTIAFVADFPFGYREAHLQAQYVIGDDTIDFTIDDMVDFSFKWGGDIIVEEDSLPFATFNLNDGSYNIVLTVIEKATNYTFGVVSEVVIQNPLLIRIPNVFTPNGDGVNDLFTIFYNGETVLEITIFSRTGTQVFNSKSPSIIWDGRNSSGSELSEGIYFYILKLNDAAIPEQTGFFHLYNKKL